MASSQESSAFNPLTTFYILAEEFLELDPIDWSDEEYVLLTTAILAHLLTFTFGVLYTTLNTASRALTTILDIAKASISFAHSLLVLSLIACLALSTSLCLTIIKYQNIRHMIRERVGKPATAFTLFPDLPAEIREMIWREAAMAPQIVAFKEVFSEGPNWSVTLGSQGAIPYVSKEAHKQAMKCRLPEFVGANNAASIREWGFEVIWLMSNSEFDFLESYWLGNDAGIEDDRPRRLAVPLSTWKSQIQDRFTLQLLIRLRRLRVSELFLVIEHKEPRNTLIRFVTPLQDPVNLKIQSGSGRPEIPCEEWTTYEDLSRSKLQEMNQLDVIQKQRYYLEGGETREGLETLEQYKSFRMWRQWTAPRIRCVKARFVG